MNSLVAELDKSVISELPEDYGTIKIRIVVIKRVNEDQADTDVPEVPLDIGEDEVLPTGNKKTPISGYLEDSKRGKECCVFLINGQRQDARDNSFIVQELDKKYLRNRMLIVVDLDGLNNEAIADLMSGDRQGFFQGKTYAAIVARVAAALKKDPDLERLEEEAEKEISELRTGDEAVKQALDQLIDDHHASADHVGLGPQQTGEGKGQKGFGKDINAFAVVGPQESGAETDGPYLVGVPVGSALRLHPDTPTALRIGSIPAATWPEVGPLHVEIKPPIDNLSLQTVRNDTSALISINFDEPDGWDDDSYPIETSVRITAMITGHDEPRVLERKIVISKPKKRNPPKPTVLLDVPSYIKVSSRQPVMVLDGDADIHVRLRWDGKDSLATGEPPDWVFSAVCTNATLAPIAFTKPKEGRFELLIQPPKGLPPGEQLLFDIFAAGLDGGSLKTSLVAQVAPPPLPRKVKRMVPEPSSQRRPPYDLSYIDETNWQSPTCWGQREWNSNDTGCFLEPSATKPLTIIINTDMGLLKHYRESLVARKLEPATIKERTTRYTSHVAFHLYQMHQHFRDVQAASKDDADVRPPTQEEQSSEINRVASTLVKVMEVSR